MEKADKEWLMIRIGVSEWMFLQILAHLGSPGQRAVKRLLLFCLALRFITSYGVWNSFQHFVWSNFCATETAPKQILRQMSLLKRIFYFAASGHTKWNTSKQTTDKYYVHTERDCETWSAELTLLTTNCRIRSCPMSDLSPCLNQSRSNHAAFSCYISSNIINCTSSNSTRNNDLPTWHQLNCFVAVSSISLV